MVLGGKIGPAKLTKSVRWIHKTTRCFFFKVHGSVHRKNILIYIQQDVTLHSLFHLKTALNVSGGTSTHHQERKQLYLQHLIFVTPLLLPAAMAAGSSNGVYVTEENILYLQSLSSATVHINSTRDINLTI